MPFGFPSKESNDRMSLNLSIEQVSQSTGLSISELMSLFEYAPGFFNDRFTVETLTDVALLEAMGYTSLTKIKAGKNTTHQFYIWLYKEEGSDEIKVKEVLPIRHHSVFSALSRIKTLTEKSEEEIKGEVLSFLEEFDGFLTVEDRGDYIKLIGLKEGELKIRIILKPISKD